MVSEGVHIIKPSHPCKAFLQDVPIVDSECVLCELVVYVTLALMNTCINIIVFGEANVCCANSYFAALVVMGLRAHGKSLLSEVALTMDPRACHQAFRSLLRNKAGKSKQRVQKHDNLDAITSIELSMGEVAMLVVTELEEAITVNIIDGESPTLQVS